MTERESYRVTGEGTNESPYSIDGDIDSGLAEIARKKIEKVMLGETVIIDTNAGIFSIRQRKAGNRHVVYEATPEITVRQDLLFQYASVATSLFASEQELVMIERYYEARR